VGMGLQPLRSAADITARFAVVGRQKKIVVSQNRIKSSTLSLSSICPDWISAHALLSFWERIDVLPSDGS